MYGGRHKPDKDPLTIPKPFETVSEKDLEPRLLHMIDRLTHT
jgi:hypothetical protein